MRRSLALLASLVLAWLLVGSVPLLAQKPITVEWDPNTDNTVGYVVSYRALPNGTPTTVDVGNVSAWILTAAVDTVAYGFTLFAYNSVGALSLPSAEAVAPPVTTDPVPPPGPQGAPEVRPASLLPPPILINFQPSTAPRPAGYLADTGLPFADRGNGYSYGWNRDTSAATRDRNDASSPDQQHDTLIHLQRPENPDAIWEIAVPNGVYDVRLVAGDPGFVDSVYAISAEGVLVVSGTPTPAVRWIDHLAAVTVSDGRLTVRSAGGSNNKLCFAEITPR